MALINCPECGKEISEKAGSCPNCGCPLKNTIEKVVVESKKTDGVHYARPTGSLPKQEKPKKKRIGLWIVIGIIVLFVGCGSCMGGSDTDDSEAVIDNPIEEVSNSRSKRYLEGCQ